MTRNPATAKITDAQLEAFMNAKFPVRDFVAINLQTDEYVIYQSRFMNEVPVSVDRVYYTMLMEKQAAIELSYIAA